jgi:hypothetical protein
MQLYAVKLNEGHKARPDQQFDGWLGSGYIEFYTRGEAIKKARVFGGSIKPMGKKYTVKSLNVLQLSKKDIHKVIVHKLKGMEAFKDTQEIDEPLYQGDVFETIMGEISEITKIKGTTFPPNFELELTVLNNICINADYIMLVD